MYFGKIIDEDIQRVIDSEYIDWEIFRNSNFLITGSTGLIGSALARTLMVQKRKVKDILNLSNFKSYEEFCDTLNIKIIGIKENNHKFDKVEGYIIRSYKVKHTTETYGFVIEDKENKKIGFTGDSCLCEGVEKIIKNSEVIFCDTSKLVGDHDSHMGFDNINWLLSKYVNKKIITTHMNYDTKCEISKLNNPYLIIGNDGIEINI